MESGHQGTFDIRAFLDSAGIARTIVEYGRADVIFIQGEPCDSVLYIQKGCVKLSVRSKTGREAVVAMLGSGDCFGEGCLAGQSVRMGSATAITGTTFSAWTKIGWCTSCISSMRSPIASSLTCCPGASASRKT